MRKPILFLAVALATAVTAAALSAPQTTPATRPAPRLVVVVSVDQLAHDRLIRLSHLMTGGFKTFLARGAVFENARYRHANCETGPGHSAMLSGRNAHRSGIIANGWYDESLGRVVNVVDDPSVTPVGGAGRAASPAYFVGFTLGDLLKKAQPRTRVVGVALKDRAAILMAGPRADAAYWYEAAEGRFITSTYYMKAVPPWLHALNARRLPDTYGAEGWNRLLGDVDIYNRFAGEDAVPTEGDLKNITFPHPIGVPGSAEFYSRFRTTPFADELTLDVALAALNAHDLGADDATDILAVGFSATDYIGHAFGPESHEYLDQLLRLDRTLQRLIEAAQAKAGADRTLFVLTSDHGVMPLVESLQRKGVASRRVLPADLQKAGQAALEKRFPGARDLVAAYLAPDFYLNLTSIAQQSLRRQDVEKTLGDALMATGVVAKIYTATSFAGDPPPVSEDPYFDAVRRSYFASRSPHVIARLAEFAYLTSSPGGTGHGSPYEYDRHVPLMFLGPSVRASRYDGETGPEDIAPSLARILGLDYPLQDARRVLTEMILP